MTRFARVLARFGTVAWGLAVGGVLPAAAQSAVQGGAPVAERQMFSGGALEAQPAASAVSGQQTAQPATPTPSTGPSIAAERAGIAPSSAPARSPNAVDVGAGENVALMVAGGAALVAGLLIGGNGGAAIAIGGAVIGLYGLFNYLK